MSNKFDVKNSTRENNAKSTIMALFLTLTIATTLVASPAANAHTPPLSLPTYAFLALSPDPVGVGQTVFIVMWLHGPPPTALGIGGDRWHDFTIEITAPDGKTQTLGPFMSDPTGSTYTLYTPDQIGTYKFVFKYSGQKLSLYNPQNGIAGTATQAYGDGVSGDYINDTYLPSSTTAYLTVQQERVTAVEDYPLPTGYWTRPIEGQNTRWSSIASNWLGGGQVGGTLLWQKNGIAPNSAHIMWTEPIEFGGILGGTTPIADIGFYSGGAYEGRFTSAIVMAGQLYYQEPLGHSNVGGGYTCRDLRTGEILWHRDDIGVAGGLPAPTFGQLFDYESMNQHGVVGGALWGTQGTTWVGYDGYTGKNVYNLTNVPSGFEVYTDKGEILRYVLNYNRTQRKGWLGLWNSTADQTGLQAATGTGSEAYQWRPNGKSVNMGSAYSWNVTVGDLSGLAAPSIVGVIPNDVIVGTSTTFPRFGGTPDPYTMWAISDKPTNRGQLLWIKNYSAPQGFISLTLATGMAVDPVNRRFFLTEGETMNWLAYSVDDGSLVWGPLTGATRAFSYYGSGSGTRKLSVCAYGYLYVQGYGGEIVCYDTKNGAILWKYNNTNSGLDTPWGLRPIFISAVADGKVYAFNNEHSPNYPLYKGQKVYCIDAYTGKELWTVQSWAGQTSGSGTSTSVLAEGFLAYYNYYDNQLYCIGKGPSLITISAPQTIVPKGTGVLLTGTVTDQSSGAKKLVEDGKFSVVPAVSDASMSGWMEYLYMQKPKPQNVAGVTVKLTAYDPNGNSQDVGSTKTDANGRYAITWTPKLEGMHSVVAEFEGSNSYWGSQDTAYFAVGPAVASPSASATPAIPTPSVVTPTSTPIAPTSSPYASPSQPPPPTEAPDTALYIGVAAVVVLAAVAAVAVLLRRRR
ncbi:MAG: PQQ-binding-like beta-propeller repeat protein [Candidatus Bathyarchaeia archaeon]